MLGTIIALALTAGTDGEDNTYFATLRDPVVDVLDNLFIHYAYPEQLENLELWSAPIYTGEKDDMFGIQIAKSYNNPRAIGTLPDGKHLLVLSEPPNSDVGSLAMFDITNGSHVYTLELPSLGILEASITYDGLTLSYVSMDEMNGQVDVWSVPVWKWINEQRKIEKGEEIENPVKPVRLSNDLAIEHHLIVSRTGAFAAWTIGTGPSVLKMSKIDGSRRFLLKRSTGYIYARDFYPRDKYLLWESFDSSGGLTTPLRQFGWTTTDRLISRTMMFYQGEALDPLRPKLNADGTMISLIIRTTQRETRAAHEDSSPAFIPIMDGPEFPMFFTAPQLQKHSQVTVGQNLTTIGAKDMESVDYQSRSLWMHPLGFRGTYVSTAWHPTRPQVIYQSIGFYQPAEKAGEFKYQAAIASARPVKAIGSGSTRQNNLKGRHAQLPMLRGYKWPDAD